MDMHMEHLNKVCKEAISGLGVNKTPKAIIRIGKCLGVLTSVVQNYVEQASVNEVAPGHNVAQDHKDLYTVIEELLAHSIFSLIPGRFHVTFKNIDCSLFSKFTYEKITEWMKDHIPI